MKPERQKIARCLLALATERGVDKTFCPSEATRRLAPDAWRESMPQVRAAAIHLVEAGKLRCTQRGRGVNPTKIRAHSASPFRIAMHEQ